MVKRIPRAGAKPARPKTEPKAAAWPQEQHSGEGSASAMESMQRLESRRRLAARPADPHRIGEPPESS